jgi:microcystin-dependent protein
MMNNLKRFVFVVMPSIICLLSKSQVGVNVLTPHPSAALQVESPAGITRGMLTPSMTTVNRISISTGTSAAADGLIVYDVNHCMHYYFQAAASRWVSMSPLSLSTTSTNTGTSPSGVITTPSSTAIFSLGINKQNPTAALDVVGNTTISGSVITGGKAEIGGGANIAGQFSVSGFPVNPLVPAGTIVMWSGNSIPTGWAECDGSNGTPDLRGRFIVAAGQSQATPVAGDFNPNYSVNSTGGENRHVLTVAELAKHQHQANGDGASIAANGGGHFHTVTPNGQGTGESRSNGNTGGLANDSPATIGTSSNTHSHPNGEFSGVVGDGTTNGVNNQAHENRPQYFVLKFIMKM